MFLKYYKIRCVCPGIHASLTNNPKNNDYNYQWYNGFIHGSDANGYPYFKDSLQAANRYVEKYKSETYNTNKRIWKSCIKNFTNKKYVKYCKQHYNWTDMNECRWNLGVVTGRFQTLGIMNQILYIDPIKNIIIVRLGETSSSNYKYGGYDTLMEEIMNALSPYFK